VKSEEGGGWNCDWVHKLYTIVHMQETWALLDGLLYSFLQPAYGSSD